mmetsp:Transcript_182/g.279  ORF Transcript_182/g.279 Transcript_182/m.279 type:complete len:87 (+) Transcript_182:27-287(+)
MLTSDWRVIRHVTIKRYYNGYDMRSSTLGQVLLFLGIVAINCQINQTIGISPLIIVPGDDLVEIVIQVDAGRGVHDGASRVMHKVL